MLPVKLNTLVLFIDDERCIKSRSLFWLDSHCWLVQLAKKHCYTAIQSLNALRSFRGSFEVLIQFLELPYYLSFFLSLLPPSDFFSRILFNLFFQILFPISLIAEIYMACASIVQFSSKIFNFHALDAEEWLSTFSAWTV